LPTASSTRLAETVREKGIVGAGGAGFPTHIKISSPCDTVIANGAECEPLLAGDRYLLLKDYRSVISGLKLVMESTGARKGILAIKKKETEAATVLEEELRETEGIDLFLLDNFYPAGDEFLLVYEITGRVVPEGGLPINVGCIVQNVETLHNISRAVEHNTPVTRRTLTCTGEVKTPSVVTAHIGTSFREIIGLCGGVTGGASLDEDYVIIAGGPLMGEVVTDPDTPVTKLTTGLIVLPASMDLVVEKTLPMETIIRRSRSACCQCTYCTELCPRYLLGYELYPHKIMRQVNLGLEEPEEAILNAILCSECALCETYACPMGLSPSRVNRVIKMKLKEAGYKPPSGRSSPVARDMREYRRVPSERLTVRLKLQQYEEMRLREGVLTDPRRVELLMKQHTGEPAIPVVKQGVQVEEGQLIGEIPDNRLGARVHASISGKVTFVDGARVIITREAGG